MMMMYLVMISKRQQQLQKKRKRRKLRSHVNPNDFRAANAACAFAIFLLLLLQDGWKIPG